MSVRSTPPTPRSRRLGRELKKLREARKLTMEVVAQQLQGSASRVSRIESGEIGVKPGVVLELLRIYGEDLNGELGLSLVALARESRESGWWRRLGESLSSRYLTFITYEAEATDLRNFESALVPGLLQTADYAKAVTSVGREMNEATTRELTKARLTRQAVLTRKPDPLRVHAIISEAALTFEVGGADVLGEQLIYLAELGQRPNIVMQVLRFEAGEYVATIGPFQVLSFAGDEPPLGYVETQAGELFLESPREIGRLNAVFDHLLSLAMSPAESIKYIKGRVRGT